IIEADVLCIGGGIAGLMAAIRASELGAKVVVAEKGNTLTSGAGGLGNGNSGGHGGGNANGHGGGNSASASGRGGGKGGSGHATGRGQGHANTGHGHGHGHGHGNASRHGVSASTLGSLNAAHASATARANAAPNSAVGAIAAFAAAVESTELTNRERVEAAAQALASQANKPITAPVVSRVGNLANVEVSRREARAIAHRASQIQGDGS
ncbi:MAG: FAD-binding protein, partial [Gammaproteobacteria bacterium]|nr:FAD-binding protein [Gammaproteobacteria bacterium]